MTSDLQIAANRANAGRNAGPGPAARQVTRANALRHGLAAESLMVLPHEDAAAYAELCAAMREDIAPGDRVEEQLALRVAGLLWRLARAGCLEGGLYRRGDLREERDRHQPPESDLLVVHTRMIDLTGGVRPERPGEPAPQVEGEREARRARIDAALAAIPMAETFASDSRGGDAFTRLSRYERSLQRSLDQTLANLDRRRILRQRDQPILEIGDD